MKRLLLAAVAALLLQACTDMRTFPDVAAGEPIAAQGAPRPLILSKVRVNLEPGTPMARKMTGAQCGNVQALNWTGEHPDALNPDLAHSFNTQFQAAHYKVIGGGDDLFDNGSAASAEFQVGAIVDWLTTDYCYPWAGVAVYGDIKGFAYARIQWQVYDVLSQKIVYKGTSEGRYNITHTEPRSWHDYLDHALDQAVRNLLADPRLSQALGSEPQLGSQAAAPASPITASDTAGTPEVDANDAAPIQISAAQAAAGIEAPRAATVMIYTATSLGSGVIVGTDGYILTNYHVVRDASRVRVKLADNSQQIAQVLRRDSRRDVALLKIDGSNHPAAALRLPPDVQVGDEVFAIGSPLEEQNALTVTRGIISAFRNDHGYPIIQSDVSIQHGNSGGPLVDRNGKVVALCVAGEMNAVNTSVGLNFFIPIDDAVNRLHIQFQ